jgi:hypothetical protein
MSKRTIVRDPFTRAALVRYDAGLVRTCDWCGNRAGKFRYAYDPDSGPEVAIKGQFCSVGCMRAYHG